jgi:murein DD-endopeptidase MepM/ murein hydrolase activator NlpD
MAGFKRWLFQPGMRFNSRETWWGERKPRATPHEGVDLCCLEDAGGQIKNLDKNIKIPATFAGEIIKIADDFLGQSIFLAHEIYATDGRQLCTAYGHTRPLASLQLGQIVAAGEIIAAVSSTADKKSKVTPHLHLTLAWLPVPLEPDRLTWPNLGRDPAITLLDPLAVLTVPA